MQEVMGSTSIGGRSNRQEKAVTNVSGVGISGIRAPVNDCIVHVNVGGGVSLIKQQNYSCVHTHKRKKTLTSKYRDCGHAEGAQLCK